MFAPIRQSEAHAGQAETTAGCSRLLTLPPKYREVLVLKDVEGLASRRFAPSCVCHPALKMPRIRARARMRDRLEEVPDERARYRPDKPTTSWPPAGGRARVTPPPSLVRV